MGEFSGGYEMMTKLYGCGFLFIIFIAILIGIAVGMGLHH